MAWTDRDDENEPRNAAAIRTAILLGANFIEHPGREQTYWSVEGISMGRLSSKAMCAWMYLMPFGIGIDKDAKPAMFKDIEP